jgi:hypothetical protein
MTDAQAGPRTVVVWVTEGTWRGCVDAARALVPAGAAIVLLHTSPDDVPGAAHGAYAGLLGRGHPERDPGPRLARPCTRVERRGRVERAVVAAAAGADLLIVARDGDRSRLGPRSLGHAGRFVVDHAPCAVLLVWPEEAPGPGTIPPAPPPHPPGHRPRR